MSQRDDDRVEMEVEVGGMNWPHAAVMIAIAFVIAMIFVGPDLLNALARVLHGRCP